MDPLYDRVEIIFYPQAVLKEGLASNRDSDRVGCEGYCSLERYRNSKGDRMALHTIFASRSYCIVLSCALRVTVMPRSWRYDATIDSGSKRLRSDASWG